MDAASRIRSAVDQVTDLRRAHAGDERLWAAIRWIKRWQHVRFSRTYADLLGDSASAAAVRFFLEELYSDADFARRDQQFHRIAGAIGGLFPRRVGDCAAALAELHGLTETLDDQMARLIVSAPDFDGGVWPEPALTHEACLLYAQAWRSLGRQDDRFRQLHSVSAIGRQLTEFTQTPGLRSMLRMMRGPAIAGGLSELQHFLESGFDTFSELSRSRGGAQAFIQTIERREAEGIHNLSAQPPTVSAAWLVETYGQARV